MNVTITTASYVQVLPKKADWIKQSCVSFDPENNKIQTDDGKFISYKYLIVAMGIQLNYNAVRTYWLNFSVMLVTSF